MYAVVGITGNTGSIVATTLLAQGKQVRGIVRNANKAAAWRAQGAEIVVAELSDLQAMAAAFEGIEGLYLMTPTYAESTDMFADNTRDLTVLQQAIQTARVPKVVMLSSIGAQLSNGTGAILKLHEMEERFFGLPIASVSIRAGWFMENFAGLIGMARDKGILPSFLNPLDRAIPMVATRDIGSLAATLLQQTWSGKRVVELEGPNRLSPNDVAAAFSRVLHREVTAQVLPRDQWFAAFQGWGLTSRSAEAMIEMNEGFNRNWIVFEGPPAEHVAGKTTLDEVLRGIVSK